MLATCVIQPIDMIKVTSSFHLSVLFLYLFLQMDFWVCSIFVAGFRSVGFCVRFLFLCVVGFDGFGGVEEVDPTNLLTNVEESDNLNRESTNIEEDNEEELEDDFEV